MSRIGQIGTHRDRYIPRPERIGTGGRIYFEAGPDDIFGRFGSRLRYVREWLQTVCVRTDREVHFFELVQRETPRRAVYLVYQWSGARRTEDLDD